MAEMTRAVPEGRHRNRRQAMLVALRGARTRGQKLAVAAAYFRSVFIRADDETVDRVSQALIEMTDEEARKAGERS